MKISTISLCSCTGCHMSLLNLGEDLVKLLPELDFQHSPVLMDSKTISETDIILVEGGIRNQDDIKLLKGARDNSETLVSLGTCATYGGVPGIGTAFPTLDLIRRAIGDRNEFMEVPTLSRRLSPIDTVVEVDYYLPGCPPPSELIGKFLTSIIAGQSPTRVSLPVCAECERKVKEDYSTKILRLVNRRPDPNECLLSQGYICLGSVSRGGCGAQCTNAGHPCFGCRGPSDRVLLDPLHGIIEDLINRISHFAGTPREEIEKQLFDFIHFFYGFTMASQTLRKKWVERVAELIYRVIQDGEDNQD
ncbi:MAG: F420-nonreducing hydrogenase [Candidatus Hodarchaeota archaeon]